MDLGLHIAVHARKKSFLRHTLTHCSKFNCSLSGLFLPKTAASLRLKTVPLRFLSCIQLLLTNAFLLLRR